MGIHRFENLTPFSPRPEFDLVNVVQILAAEGASNIRIGRLKLAGKLRVAIIRAKRNGI